MNFQERLKELREAHKYSQLELAKKLNISNVTLSQYENGVRKPDLDTLSRIADFFEVTTDYLLGKSSHPELSRRNELDIEKMIANMEEEIKNGSLRLSMDGEEIDEEIMEYLIQSYKDTIVLAKIKSKEKFTPKKYRKDNNTDKR